MFADEPDVMGVKKAAELFDVSPLIIRREIDRGNLECVYVGRRVRAARAALLRRQGERA